MSFTTTSDTLAPACYTLPMLREMAMSPTRTMKRIGLRIDPCLTPYLTSMRLLRTPSQFTRCFSPDM
jgi:hypothetical protein